MAPKPSANSLNQIMMVTYATPENPNEQIIHDALMNGRKVLDSSVYLGADHLQHTYSEYLPDGSVRRIIEDTHLDGSKDTQIRYLDPAHFRVLGSVDTHTEHGVETVVGVQENVPGSIDVQVGDTRVAPKDESSAAGLVPNSWDPTHNDTPEGTPPANNEQHEVGTASNPNVSCWENTGPKGAFEQTPCSPCSLGNPNAHEDPQSGVCVEQFDGSTTIEVLPPGTSDNDANSDIGATKPGGNHDGDGNHGDGTDDHDGNGGPVDGTDGHDDGNGDHTVDHTPTGNPDGDMPNPDGGPGTPNSTPNPEGGDDGGEDNHHGPILNQGTSVGQLSTPLAATGNSQGATGNGNYHGPHDPGEEMPNPEDTGGGNPVSDIAHSMRDFWSGAAAAIQGENTSLHLSAAANHAAFLHSALAAAAMITAQDAPGALSDTSSHSVSNAHDLSGMHTEAHGELGTTTLHDALALHGGSLATQMFL